MRLTESITPRARFSRSINVERDASSLAIEGYIPTGRALDVVRRVVRSMNVPSSGRSFSITGPHGSGKSSLAVFLSGLTAPSISPEFEIAFSTLQSTEPSTADQLLQARARLNASSSGFIPCVVSATREPVIETVARAFAHGAQRFFNSQRSSPIPKDWSTNEFSSKLTPRDIREKLGLLTEQAPVLLLIDEFGKNLEAYSDTARDGDPFLLQELAEWASGDSGGPLVVITMQHLAFEEYVHETSSARRREWVKVQGRFEDIAYVETTSQSRRLISSAFHCFDDELSHELVNWGQKVQPAYSEVGLRDLFEDGVAQSSFPLHPIVLASLPELCSRYGQNERTLFSFLTGPEPHAVPEFMKHAEYSKGGPLPFVRLADVYDYFVASASTMISSVSSGGRWVEIESRIRDSSGLNEFQQQVLKSIGVLNLISAGGSLRASRSILALALEDGSETNRLEACLDQLEDRGLVTYRDFADEYRIWQGSDFDLRGTVETARRRCLTMPIHELLNSAAPLSPLVAARHSQQYGTLRIFDRRFSSLQLSELVPPKTESEWDGLILLSLSQEIPKIDVASRDKPIIAVIAEGSDGLHEAAVDAASLAEALKSAESLSADWVARRELIERFAVSSQRLRDEVERTFDTQKTTWHLLGSEESFDSSGGPSRVLSQVADHVYFATPSIPNEMITRRELSSQGSKARRLLIEGMLLNPSKEHLGIQSFPAERAMYDAVLGNAGLHTSKAGESSKFQPPTNPSFLEAWNVIVEALERAKAQRVVIDEVWRDLQAPPVGLKDGPIPILLIVALILNQDDVALYEHGTLVLGLDDAVAERFVRNPGHFAVKNTAVSSEGRRQVVAKLAKRLKFDSYLAAPTFLGVARRLFALLRQLEPYALGTKSVSEAADSMRKAFRSASEPDRLMFEDLPKLFGLDPIQIDGKVQAKAIDEYVDALGAALEELRDAYPSLLQVIETELARALAEPRDQLRRSFSVHAAALSESVLEPRLKAFVTAACRDELSDQEWLENLAMVVADAAAPKSWTDATVERFRLASTELGGAFRRVSALIGERRALENEKVDTLPIAITRLDGREGRLVLWATAKEKRAVGPQISAMLEEMTSVFGSLEKAREVFLALLLDEENDSESISLTSVSSTDVERKSGHG